MFLSEIVIESPFSIIFSSHLVGQVCFSGRLLPLYFPRDKNEEEIAATKLPGDVGDENGETVISERKIRISALPGTDGSLISTLPVSGNVTPTSRSVTIKRWVLGTLCIVQYTVVKHTNCVMA